jgi:hypothetical protein
MRRHHIRRYEACPECTQWSLRVEENGRLARHSRGFGYVERFPPGSPGARRGWRPSRVCSGSGRKVAEAVGEAARNKTRAHEKQLSRDRDEQDLTSGRKSRKQLREENGHFSRLKIRPNLAAARALS